MMPVIRLSDASFVDLKSISTWMGTETPSETIDKLVREKMQKLDMERDDGDFTFDDDDSSSGPHVFLTTPGLSFTRILSVSINDEEIEKTNWAGLLLKVIKIFRDMGLSKDQLVKELQVPSKVGEYIEDGYKYYPKLGISIQGQSAPEAWKEISRIANKTRISLEVEFQWRDHEKAQYPGRIGIIRAGKLSNLSGSN